MALTRRGRRSGFSLVEVVVATTILTLGALLLSVSLTSAQRMSSLAREQAIVNNAIRAYIERMRQLYPSAGGSEDMSGLLADGSTPADVAFLASGSIEASALKGVECLVLKNRTEAPATPRAWDHAVRVPGTITLPQMTAGDVAALGGPRDLNGNGNSTDGTIATTLVRAVTVKIEFRWLSGSGPVGPNTAKQRLVTYAIFTPQH